MVKRGPEGVDLESMKRWILERVEAEGEVSWKTLWDKERFGSPRHLSRCLKELVKEGVIEKTRISHKNQRYGKVDSYRLLRTLIDGNDQIEKRHPEVLEELGKMRTGLTDPMLRTAYISALILAEFRSYLFLCERAVRAPRLYTSWVLSFLQRSVQHFGDMLYTCGAACPDETDRAIQIVQWILHHHLGKIGKTMQKHRPQLEPLPDLNLEKGKNGYRRLLETLKNKEQERNHKQTSAPHP